MSMSVDDLICSFSSSHIGQEALDLAALQAQLSQAFLVQSSASSASIPQKLPINQQRCNTPTGRTPSSSFSWGAPDIQRTTRWNTEDSIRDLDDVEDERMVEDLLLPSSPHLASPFTQQSFRPSRSYSRATPSSATPTSVPESSDFTSTDPFYLAQLQAMQVHNTSSPSSVFSQLGRPSTQSSFTSPGQKYEPFGYPGSSISLETHNMFATASVAFDRR